METVTMGERSDGTGEQRWTVLVSGLCSVGKSSFVGALWGDPELLPTAVRDCTQVNTLLIPPQNGESDRQARAVHLARERAVGLVLRDIQYHRLFNFLSEVSPPQAARLDSLLPEERLRTCARDVRQLFAEKPSLAVLHEPRTDDLEQLEQFLSFLDSGDYRPGGPASVPWATRGEQLMGRRRPDGRLVDTGRMLAFSHVELVRGTAGWSRTPPRLIDTPWIPAFHNAHRFELILEQAREADVLVVLALPQIYQPEEWLLKLLRERPGLARRTLVVFNQADTIDAAALFSRDGFANVFEGNRERLGKLGFDPENLFLACARLPFLELSPRDEFVEQRIARLKTVLARLASQTQGRPVTPFIERLRAACDPADAGLKTIRARLEKLAQTPTPKNLF